MTTIYTAITFAPVQGFIEKSRKLRDLYGSSYILSYLSNAICKAAGEKHLEVISPANLNITTGTPNFILIKDSFPKEDAKAAFDNAWNKILQHCKDWIEAKLQQQWKQNTEDEYYLSTDPWKYTWHREWTLWANHAWEFFWAEAEEIKLAKQAVFTQKRSRVWVAINYTGESSTLSGADAITHPSMGTFNPKKDSYRALEKSIHAFYHQLSYVVGEAFISDIETKLKGSSNIREKTTQRFGQDFCQYIEKLGNGEHRQEAAKRYGEPIINPTEELSIPELVKRLITLEAIAAPLEIPANEIPLTYRDLNRLPEKQAQSNLKLGNQWTGWFLGDGDNIGKHLEVKSPTEITAFSKAMLNWGRNTLKDSLEGPEEGRIIYAGGDDFLGIFYRPEDESPLHPSECLIWFNQFYTNLWPQHQQPITVSVGFVWAGPNVPQREVLQHCREAEKSAKHHGRDRIALRVLFNDGKYLEWVCPWSILPVLQDYRDRNKRDGKQQWAHLFGDIAILEGRHAFLGKDSKKKNVDNNLEVALALFNAYFASSSESAWNNDSQQEFYKLMESPPDNLDHPDWWQQKPLWNKDEDNKLECTGILGDQKKYCDDGTWQTFDPLAAKAALTDWIISLSKVGFHLCSNT
jgi:CRISPR-associated protein Cmr2